jgi:cysteinyl-tRNA synthetase
MKLYNTLSKKYEEFKPLNPPKVTFYHCGPTVYWAQHIGNLRGMVMADLIRRSIEYFGYQVDFVRNYTDVGHLVSDQDEGIDKMEKAAQREKISPEKIADKYIKIFEEDCQRINIIPPTHKPRATQYIQKMIDMIQVLIDKGHAYKTELAIYFDVPTFRDYNRLNRQKIDLNIKGIGKGKIDDPQKKHFADFSLWFFKKGAHKNALQTWPSPWGDGFPGWHIECSVMSKALLGNTIDIHMGGIEHISIHHTNEIAQSESANGKPFVHYWLHNEHLTINNNKMAKSEGTGLLLDEILKKSFDPLALRYLFLTAHYRTRQDFSWEALEASQNTLNNLRRMIVDLKKETTDLTKNYQIAKYENDFKKALENDIEIPSALAVLWTAIKSDLNSKSKLELINRFDKVFGLDLDKIREEKIPEEIIGLAELRQLAREKKDFKKSDEMRKQIIEKGFLIKDSSDGYQIKRAP